MSGDQWDTGRLYQRLLLGWETARRDQSWSALVVMMVVEEQVGGLIDLAGEVG